MFADMENDGMTTANQVKHCWPKPWIEAAMQAGFAHYKGNGEWEFISDHMRDMLAKFAELVAQDAAKAPNEE
jgi:hypothetical protein